MESSEAAITPILTVDYTAPALDTTLRVNSQISESQITAETGGSTVARSANGDSIVVWSSDKQDGQGFGVYAQRYDSGGARLGGEIHVSSETAQDQVNPAVAVDDFGNFVVVWESDSQDTDRFGIYGQRFDSSGSKIGSEFRVNTTIAEDQKHAAVAMNGAGQFVVVWQSDGQDGDGFGIYAQRYNAAGGAVGDEFLVNTLTSFDQRDPSVAITSSGEFVVTWTAANVPDGDGLEIIGQRFDSDGNRVGLEFQVNRYLTDDQYDSSVSMDDSGNFAIVWTSFGQDGDNEGVYGQTFNREGSLRSEEFLIPTSTVKEQEHATVSMQGDGDLVVSWTHRDTGNIYYRHFNLDGLAHNEPTLVDTTTTAQEFSGIAIDDLGGLTIAWSGNASANDSEGVFAKFTGPNSNVKPLLTLPAGALNYAESDPPAFLGAGAMLSDADSANFDGGKLTSEFILGGTLNDRLQINHEGFGAGQIGISGSSVKYENVDIGTFAGGSRTSRTTMCPKDRPPKRGVRECMSAMATVRPAWPQSKTST
jgi:hypothetical protein